jgi:hypothetical protein
MYEKKTIDVTPKWQDLMPQMIEMLENPKSNIYSKIEVKEELMRLAKMVDDIIENKSLRRLETIMKK